MSHYPRSDVLFAAAARTAAVANSAGTAIDCAGAKRASITLDVTAMGGVAGDTLDVFVDVSPASGSRLRTSHRSLATVPRRPSSRYSIHRTPAQRRSTRPLTLLPGPCVPVRLGCRCVGATHSWTLELTASPQPSASAYSCNENDRKSTRGGDPQPWPTAPMRPT